MSAGVGRDQMGTWCPAPRSRVLAATGRLAADRPRLRRIDLASAQPNLEGLLAEYLVRLRNSGRVVNAVNDLRWSANRTGLHERIATIVGYGSILPLTTQAGVRVTQTQGRLVSQPSAPGSAIADDGPA